MTKRQKASNKSIVSGVSLRCASHSLCLHPRVGGGLYNAVQRCTTRGLMFLQRKCASTTPKKEK